jgi:hypothetical protein
MNYGVSPENPGTSFGYSPATVFGSVPIVTSMAGLKIVDQYDQCSETF